MKSKESARIDRLFAGTGLPEQDNSARNNSGSSNSDSGSGDSYTGKMSADEEKRLASRYLTTDAKVAPPKPKWNDNSYGSSQQQPTPKRELPQLNIHRPKMKQTETEKLIGAGLSEEEIIAKKKRELEQKAYMKKKKESAKDLTKWKEKDQEAARRDLDSRQASQRMDQEAREREIRAAEERRVAEQKFQLERERSIMKEAHFHSKEFSDEPKRILPQDQYIQRVEVREEEPAPVQKSEVSEEDLEKTADPSDVRAQKEENRLKSRWLL